MHLLCTSINEEGGDGESVGSKALSLLSYTLRYVRLADLDRYGESAGSEALSLLTYTLVIDRHTYFFFSSSNFPS